MQAWVYMLECVDGRYYVGSYRGDDVGLRVSEHNAGVHRAAWTYHRRPVELVWTDRFDRITDAIAFERQLKGWSRAKKQAFLRGEWDRVRKLSERRGAFVKPPPASPPPSFETDASHPPQDEGSAVSAHVTKPSS